MSRGLLRSARAKLAALLLASAALTATPAFADTAAIGGTITDATTGEPVADVCVLLWKDEVDWAWEQYPESCTEADGQWSYSGLAEGTYYAVASGAGYVQQYAVGKDNSWDADRFTVADGDSVTVDMAMEPGGTITGTVTDAFTGEPVEGACVSTEGEGSTWANVCTDYEGRYEMTGLRAGSDYILRFNDYEQNRYLPEYAHDAEYWEGATRLTVVAGETTVLDEDLTPAASISGTITDAASGSPLPGICVQAMTEPEGFDAGGFGCTDDAGTYRMGGVVPGTYHVVVDDYSGAHPRTWYPSTTTPAESTPVTLEAGQQLAGIDVAMSEAAYVTGTITKASTGEPMAGVCVSGHRVDGSYLRNPGESASCSDENGQYTIGGLPTGDVKVQFSPLDQEHLQQWATGQSSPENAATFAVVAGQTTTGVDAAILEGGRISGRITEAKTKKPIEGACVTVGVFSHRSGENGTQWPSACTGADGRYEMRGLTPGTYTVEFYDPDGAWAWQFFPNKADRLNAAKIEVTAGTTVEGINAKLSPGGTIEGVVVDGATGLPAEGVCMDPYSARDPRPFGTGYCTNEDGRYVLRGLPTTKVKVQFWGNGYVPEWAFDKETFETATPIATVGGGTVTVPNVVLDRYQHE